jgi:hypothetical protein
MSELFKLICSQPMDTFLEYQALYHQEKTELTKRKIKQILEQNYKLDSLGEFQSCLKTLIKHQDGKLKLKLAKLHHNGWVWITVNPKPTIKLEEFKTKIEKLVHRKMFNGVEYAFEQRGISENDIKGYHVHILAQRNLNYKPYNLKKNIINTCKSLVTDPASNHLINIQIIGDDFAKDKEQYFKGLKTGEGKSAKQEIDKIWRINNDLQSFYSIKKI